MELKLDAPLTFQDRLVPKGTKLAGWAGLVHGLGLAVPARAPSSVAEGHIRGSQQVGCAEIDIGGSKSSPGMLYRAR